MLDAAYCCQCMSACVCAIVSPAKTVEPIEMSLSCKLWWDPRNHVLDGDPDPPREWTLLGGLTWICPGTPDVDILDVIRNGEHCDAVSRYQYCSNLLLLLMMTMMMLILMIQLMVC